MLKHVTPEARELAEREYGGGYIKRRVAIRRKRQGVCGSASTPYLQI